MDGCQEARNAITITEVPCPQCGVGVEVFIRDGSLAADAVCDACGHVIFATLSSDEFKKTAAAKKNLCGCRSNWRLEAKKSPVVPGK